MNGEPMNIRQAILMAADHIEGNPQEFNFSSTAVPSPGCGTPGCALGWIGYFYGHAVREYGFSDVAKKSMGLDEFEFYDRMAELANHRFPSEWRRNAEVCAQTMRLYANKYYPAEPVKLPDWTAIAETAPRIPNEACSQDVAWEL